MRGVFLVINLLPFLRMGNLGRLFPLGVMIMNLLGLCLMKLLGLKMFKYVVIGENLYQVSARKYDSIIEKYGFSPTAERHNAMLNEIIANSNSYMKLTAIYNFVYIENSAL